MEDPGGKTQVSGIVLVKQVSRPIRDCAGLRVGLGFFATDRAANRLAAPLAAPDVLLGSCLLDLCLGAFEDVVNEPADLSSARPSHPQILPPALIAVKQNPEKTAPEGWFLSHRLPLWGKNRPTDSSMNALPKIIELTDNSKRFARGSQA